MPYLLVQDPQVRPNVSGVGRHTLAESLWSTFKHKYYYRYTFATKAELVAAMDKWMNLYNSRRRRSPIGMLSPDGDDQSLSAVVPDQAG
ncbi:integrase core domain-containing protein [Rhodococcus jostii]|uniref:integrase core domain-containing protein n=1 Tax=Rhodococcus jostii TaxID=132919 RepID=UPI00363568FA